MGNMIETITYYLTYPFVKYALIAGALIALSTSLLGVTLVLKRYSYIGDGLSHVAFGAMAVATICNLFNYMVLVLPVTILAAAFMLQIGQKVKINGDAMIGMFSVGSLAIGYLVLNIFSSSSNITGDVCSTLFGSTSILTLTLMDVKACIVGTVLVVLIYIFFFHKIFAVTFDQEFARGTGIRVKVYQLLLTVLTATIIVLAMNLVGSLLISALVIFPTLSAMRILKTFKGVVFFSSSLAVICAVTGILISILASTPVGATIVVMNIVVFSICSVIGLIVRGGSH